MHHSRAARNRPYKRGTCPRFSPASPGKVIFVPYCANRLQEG